MPAPYIRMLVEAVFTESAKGAGQGALWDAAATANSADDPRRSSGWHPDTDDDSQCLPGKRHEGPQ